MSTRNFRSRRGVTLIEMTLTMVLTALIISAATSLYSFIAIRTADSLTRFTITQSCTRLMSEIEATATNAIKVGTRSFSGKIALVCTMPNTGVDRDGDGVLDLYFSRSTDKMLKEKYVPGKRIWFYPAGESGVPATVGNFWFRAVRADDVAISIADMDSKWSLWASGQPKIQIPGTVTFSTILSNKLAYVQINTSPAYTMRKEYGGLTRSAKIPTLDVRQNFYWRSAP